MKNPYCLGIADISKLAAYLGGVVLLLASVTTFYDVGMRFVFNSPTSWALELAEYSLLFSTFFGAPFALRTDQFIRVDIITAHLSKRTKDVLGLLSDIVVLVSFVYIVYFSGKFTHFCFLKRWCESTPLRTPLWLPLIIIPIGSLFIAIQQAVMLSERFKPGGRPDNSI